MFSRLSDEQCKTLHSASLEILERTGARLHHQPAVELLRRAGASVTEGNRVRIPAKMVEAALETAPDEVVLHNRNGEPALRVGGYRTFYGTGSDCLNILDHRSGNRRRAVLNDVVEGVTLCDALQNIEL